MPFWKISTRKTKGGHGLAGNRMKALTGPGQVRCQPTSFDIQCTAFRLQPARAVPELSSVCLCEKTERAQVGSRYRSTMFNQCTDKSELRRPFPRSCRPCRLSYLPHLARRYVTPTAGTPPDRVTALQVVQAEPSATLVTTQASGTGGRYEFAIVTVRIFMFSMLCRVLVFNTYNKQVVRCRLYNREHHPEHPLGVSNRSRACVLSRPGQAPISPRRRETRRRHRHRASASRPPPRSARPYRPAPPRTHAHVCTTRTTAKPTTQRKDTQQRLIRVGTALPHWSLPWKARYNHCTTQSAILAQP
jgi:hypothetical protein